MTLFGISMTKLRIIAGLLGLCGAVFALIFTAQRTKTQSEFMAFLHSLQGTNITKIVISDGSYDSSSVLASVSSPSALCAFAQAANAVEPYSPNHPSYARGYFIEVYLADGRKRELEFHTMPRDKMIYVYFVQRSGSWTSYYGNCKSAALFDWLYGQTPNTALEPTPTAPLSLWTVLVLQ
jgi:hypothetical protein